MTEQTAIALGAAALPTLAVLVGILLNSWQINRLDGRIDRLEAVLTSFKDLMHRDLIELFKTTGDQDSRLSRLEERTK